MTRCETCGRVLSHDRANKDVYDSERPFHFCSAQCECKWNETIRKVSVAH